MAIDFSAFDDKLDLNALQKDVNETKDTDFEDVPDGEYIVSIEKMEIKLTKAGDKLMFAVQFKIKEGEFANRMIFFNRVISGNTSPKWTDAKAIKSVMTWLDRLETDIETEFISYQDFADLVLDIFQEIHSEVELEIDYKQDAFNSVVIEEVFDL